MRIPESISALVFHIKHKWLWTIGVELCVFILMPLMTGYDDTYAGVAFLSCASIGFVGVMPLFIRETNKAHNILAAAGAVLSQLWCCLVGDWVVMLHWWVLYLLLLGLMWICRCQRYWCLVAEGWCLLAIAYILFFRVNKM